MSHPFSVPSAKRILDSLAEVFSSSQIFIAKPHSIIFLCGGPVNSSSNSVRKEFLSYANSHLSDYRFILAEDATRDLIAESPGNFTNLANFEHLLGQVSDCILIFVESPGSIAEIGFFSKIPGIIKKSLVVFDTNKQHESFIRLGPVELIGGKSGFRPVIYIDFEHPPYDFSSIQKTLTNRLPAASRAQRLDLTNYKNLSTQEQMFVILELVRLLKAVTYEGLKYCMKKIFGSVEYKTIRQLLSLLCSAGYLEQQDDYFSGINNTKWFLELRGHNLLSLEADVVDFYIRTHDQTYDIIRRFSHAT